MARPGQIAHRCPRENRRFLRDRPVTCPRPDRRCASLTYPTQRPQPVEADVRVLTRRSGFDAEPTLGPLIGCKILIMLADRSLRIRYSAGCQLVRGPECNSIN